MPSLDVHIAIARKYLEKYNDIENEIAFIKGNLDPDLSDDRIASHYTKKSDRNDLSEILKNKIRINKYLKSKSIVDDYEKGYFLHLVTDFIFFNYFLDKDYIRTTDYTSFKKDLYYSYNMAHNYLIHNYDINYYPFETEVKKRIFTSQIDANYNGEKRTNIFPYEKLDKFVNKILEKDINSYLKNFKK